MNRPKCDDRDDRIVLRKFAQQRWGDEWFMTTVEFADGDSQTEASHTVDTTNRYAIREIAMIGDDEEIYVNTFAVRPEGCWAVDR